MRLYQEIILLQTFFDGIYVIENVISYYEPLIKPQISGRHYFWSNFNISNIDFGLQIGRLNGKNQDKHRDKLLNRIAEKFRKPIIREAQIPELQILHGINIDNYKVKNKRQLLRNCVIPELGLHILNCALNIPNTKTDTLFSEETI